MDETAQDLNHIVFNQGVTSGTVASTKKENQSYRMCNRCIMDTTAHGIKFDSKGECSYCKLHDKLERLYPLNEKGINSFYKFIDKIRSIGKGKKYDCIIGISGGRDSIYLLYRAVKEWKLRPLAVNYSNGFDNPVAKENLKRAVRILNIDLRTVKADEKESKDLKIALLKSSTPNLEIGADIAILAALYGVAAKENIRFIMIGNSFRTEGISPLVWSYINPMYLKTIMDRFGTVKLRKWKPDDPGFNLDIWHLFYYIVIKKISMINPNYLVPYIRKEAEELIKKDLGWVDTGAHYFDDLYQSLIYYVYRIKFNIDKRRFNYSALIRSGQMIREEALERMNKPYVIEDPKVISMCLERLGLTLEQFQEYLSHPPKTFLDFYPNYYSDIKKWGPLIKIACQMRIIPVGTYEKFFSCI